MITNGFTYIAVLVFIAALLVWLQRYTKSKFFDYAPPIVLLYLITMILCTLGAWDMEATKPAYSVLKNNLLYAMIFLMLLRCDIRKIIKLGPKMLGGFFAASVSISLAFIATFAIMKGPLGSEAWKALGALCGSWMGGSGNMIAVQAALDIGEADMAYALVVDSIDYSIWVMFLLWAINLAPKFNKWVKADTTTLDEVSRRLEEDAKGNEDKASFVNLIFLLGLALVISAFGQDIGAALNGAMPFLDKATWTVLLITLSGLIGAVTPVGRMAGSTELSNLLLYSVVALLASRASFLELTDAPAWILAGFMILAIHGIILVLLAKIFHLDMFTCGVASLANIGGSASAPILAGAYSGALVPVGVLMALMASGMNGQSFAFHGYLPIDEQTRTRALHRLVQAVQRDKQTQIFIETPYRNDRLIATLIRTLPSQMRLCVAADISGTSESIVTDTLAGWRRRKYCYNKKPTIFLLFE